MQNLTKTIKIPSNGLFGGAKEITIRALQNKERKILLEARDFSVFEQLLRSVTVQPQQFTTENLHINDIMYVMYELRNLSFGPTYTQKHKCQHCGKEQDVTINIDEMKPIILSDEDVEKAKEIKVVLPVSQDTVYLQLIPNGKSKEIERLVKQKQARENLKSVEGYDYTLRMCEAITKIESKETVDTQLAKVAYLNNMAMKDLLAIENATAKIIFGLDRKLFIPCSNCIEEMEVHGAIVPEFFRPTDFTIN